MNQKINYKRIAKFVLIVLLFIIISEWESVKKAAIDAWGGKYLPPTENTLNE